jgi:hypothetical protein
VLLGALGTDDVMLPQPCTGTLIWFPVPADDRFADEAALALCSDCGYIVVTGSLLDERHAESPVVRAD